MANIVTYYTGDGLRLVAVRVGMPVNFLGQTAANVVIPPEIVNMVPAEGTSIYPTTPLQFDVIDSDGLTAVVLMARFLDGSYEVVYDSATFSNRYNTSAYTEITDGIRFVLRRNGGWPSGPTLKVVSVDTLGAENPQ